MIRAAFAGLLGVLALGSVRAPLPELPAVVAPVGSCALDDGGWTCRDGATQLVARVRSVDPSIAPEAVLRERFLLLSEWPIGRFGPAWAGDHLGWHAETDGEHQRQVARWWVVDGALYTVSVAGPPAEVARLAPAWLAGARFPALEPAR